MTDPEPTEPADPDIPQSAFALDARVVHGGGDAEEHAAAIAALMAAVRAMPAGAPRLNAPAATTSLSLWQASARGAVPPFGVPPGRWCSFGGPGC
ncbi:MAG: hypothetical protein Q7U41_01755 [Microbacterium sp.]|nr:hypothetical protein [Microbacterium sp.]